MWIWSEEKKICSLSNTNTAFSYWISVIIFTNLTLKYSIVLQRHYGYMITHSKTCNAFYLHFPFKYSPHNSSQDYLDFYIFNRRRNGGIRPLWDSVECRFKLKDIPVGSICLGSLPNMASQVLAGYKIKGGQRSAVTIDVFSSPHLRMLLLPNVLLGRAKLVVASTYFHNPLSLCWILCMELCWERRAFCCLPAHMPLDLSSEKCENVWCQQLFFCFILAN